jgi:hypothetical protein
MAFSSAQFLKTFLGLVHLSSSPCMAKKYENSPGNAQCKRNVLIHKVDRANLWCKNTMR